MIAPVLPTYARMPVAMERGEGMYLYDTDGKRYLDFYSGIGVMCLGHGHPDLIKALEDQGRKLWHTSNIYQIPEGERLAARYMEASFADTVFWTNSGAESIECAIKMVRKYHHDKGNAGRYRIITFASAFHGRTLAGIAAAGSEKMTKGFAPIPEGFDVVPWGDHEAVRAAITDETAAIMIEPVQGEGGIRPVPEQCLKGLRDLCDTHDLLLVCDEIQCGAGRTGKLWAHEWAGITPDILTAAKGIGGGFPVGACFATENAASGMGVGTHGSTYGGNPLAMAIGNAVLDHLLDPAFMTHVETMGALLHGRLAALQQKYALVDDVRGKGLMAGLRIPDVETRPAVTELIAGGFCPAAAGDHVIRMLPPLILTEDHIDEAIGHLDRALDRWSSGDKPTA